MNPLDIQVGGTHYKALKIQPVEFITGLGMPYCTGNVVKYLTRDKGKSLEDLENTFSPQRTLHPMHREFYYNLLKKAAFFEQFKNGQKYAQVLFYLRMGKKAKAKELLRKFINSGNYSEI